MNKMMTLLASVMLLASACTGKQASEKTASGLEPANFRTEVDGKQTDLFVLENKNGMEVCITNFGGRIVSVMVPDKDGVMRDVVLGFDSIQDYIKANDPKYVLILSGDHLYRMDYRKMLKTHIENNADLTVSVMPVPWEEASRFGILTTDPEDGRITKFTEKPEKPDSNLASMGIYIFSADVLIEALEEDALDQRSSHDFGKDIIPKLLGEGKRLYSYEFHGFWKDVGTIASFHETSMDLLGNNPEFDLFDKHFPIMSNITTRPPHYIGPDGRLDDCLVSNGCKIYGTARHSILSTDVIIEERAVVEDSVLLPGAHVKSGAHICRAILGENSTVEEGVKLGSVDTTKDTAVVGNDVVIGKGE